MVLRLLAIDAASKFGWAFGPTDGTPISGHGRFATEGSEHDAYFAGAWRWMHEKIKEWDVEAIAIEAPIHPVKTTQKTMLLLDGIHANLRSAARLNRRFRVIDPNQSTIRSFFLPPRPKLKRGEKRPRLTSEQMKLLVRRRCIDLGLVGEDVHSLDQTDALAVWAWGVHHHDPENAKRFLPDFQRAA